MDRALRHVPIIIRTAIELYHAWLDRWDERRAQRGEEGKSPANFALDSQLAFPTTAPAANIEEFCTLSEQASADPTFYEAPPSELKDVERVGQFIRFRSDIRTNTEANNVVWAKLTESGSFERVLVVFHHWNASSNQEQLANFFSKRGISVVEISMPYHFQRSRPGSTHADYMLSSNLGRTIQSVRQAVWDGRKLIQWLKTEGYGEISVLGMSLGSWVAGLLAAHDDFVAKASLFLAADSLADMVWAGRATRAIGQSLAGNIEVADLRRAWAPINLQNYVCGLSRPNLDLQLVLAKRDSVVLPDISQRFEQNLKEIGATPDVLELNCGHYSLALPPHIIFAGIRLHRFLIGVNLRSAWL